MTEGTAAIDELVQPVTVPLRDGRLGGSRGNGPDGEGREAVEEGRFRRARRRPWFRQPGLRGPVLLGADGEHYLDGGQVEGEDPLAAFSANAPKHLLRTDGFPHVADIMVGSFYDPEIDEGCAFEELISFHGGIGGPQTRPFILAPVGLPLPGKPIVGAAHVHEVLWSWRRHLHGVSETSPEQKGLGQQPAPV